MRFPPLASLLSSTSLTLLLLLSQTPRALADVVFTAPAAGAAVPAGAITITWEDGASAPALSALKTYQIQLMVGGNDATSQIAVATITTTGRFSTGNTVTGTISPAVAGNTENGFFLRMIATGAEGGTLTTYSDRFSMTGMTGATPASALAAVQALGSSTAGPPAVNQLVGDGNPNAETTTAAVAAGAGTIVAGNPAAAGQPYGMQTAGVLKYAPMQSVPPTSITAQNTAPLFPTSSFNIAKSFLPPAQFTSTVTVPQTFKVVSIQNTIPAQPQPSNDMARFLARWKD